MRQRFELQLKVGQTSINEIYINPKAWQEARNNKKAKINWQFTTEDARIKLKRLYPTLSD